MEPCQKYKTQTKTHNHYGASQFTNFMRANKTNNQDFIFQYALLKQLTAAGLSCILILIASFISLLFAIICD